MHGTECAPLNITPVWACHRSTQMRFPTPLDQLMADMEMRIITNGYTIQGVLADQSSVAWTYTIGLSKSFDLPELVITNLDNHDAVALLTWTIEQLRNGESLDDLDPLQLAAVPVHRSHLRGELMNMWREYYDEDPSSVDVIQLQLGDELTCPCCLDTQVDLADPNATFGLTQPTNRAQRRAQRKKRR